MGFSRVGWGIFPGSTESHFLFGGKIYLWLLLLGLIEGCFWEAPPFASFSYQWWCNMSLTEYKLDTPLLCQIRIQKIGKWRMKNIFQFLLFEKKLRKRKSFSNSFPFVVSSKGKKIWREKKKESQESVNGEQKKWIKNQMKGKKKFIFEKKGMRWRKMKEWTNFDVNHFKTKTQRGGQDENSFGHVLKCSKSSSFFFHFPIKPHHPKTSTRDTTKANHHYNKSKS